MGISVYKQPLVWLQEAVQSVLEQSWTDWRLRIRLDGDLAIDGPGLQWLQVQCSLDPRIKLMVGRERIGTFGSYREIFDGQECEFIVQLDADDRLSPEALEYAVAAIRQSDKAPFLYSQARVIGPNGEPYGIDPRSRRPWQENLDLVQFLYFHMRLVRFSAYMEVGGYDPDYQFAGDYDLGLRLADLGKPCHLAKPVYDYRFHPTSESQMQRRSTHEEAVQAVRAALQRRHLDREWRLIHSSIGETLTLESRQPGPLAVVGLHRCGTSLLGRCLESLGVRFGDVLLGADSDQPDGYWEDPQLLALHRDWFQASLSGITDGWIDWGWSPSVQVSPLGKRQWKSQAQTWLQSCWDSFMNCQAVEAALTYQGWGWKDPRATLILPFWDDCCPELKIIGIYRMPWDFSDALQRLKHPHFRQHPEMILPIWRYYNERLVEYVEGRSERAMLLHAESLAQAPCQLASLLQQRWDWQWMSLAENWYSELIDMNRLPHLPADDPITQLYRVAYPKLMKVVDRLQACSDLPYLGLSELPVPSPSACRPDRPMVTIVIPTHNPSHWLLEALASVERYNRRIGQIEILIIDDGTVDKNSLDLLARLRAYGYTVVHQAHAGLSAARNRGFLEARADLVLPLDDDNRLLAPYLNEAVDLMADNPRVGFVYGERVDFGRLHRLFKPGEISLQGLVQANSVDACALIRKSLWQAVGGYDESLTALEDWDFWLTAVRKGVTVGYIQKPCFEYRVCEGSMLHRHLSNVDQHRGTIDYLCQKHALSLQQLANLP